MNKLATIKLAVLGLITSPAVSAHEGHGLEGAIHDVVHGAWIIGGVLIALAAIRCLPRLVKQQVPKR